MLYVTLIIRHTCVGSALPKLSGGCVLNPGLQDGVHNLGEPYGHVCCPAHWSRFGLRAVPCCLLVVLVRPSFFVINELHT
jgi:hypothetical protein